MAEGGTLGDAAERWIVDGEINPLKSITSGANNAIGGVIYGKDPLKRGGGSGAVTGGINYISEALGSVGQTGAGAYSGMAGALVSGALSSYISGRDPRSGCGSSGMSGQGLGYSAARGYQYSTGQAEIPQGRKEKFSLGGFFQRVLTEGVTEALSSAGSFGLGKVLDVVKRGIQGRKNRGVGGSRSVSQTFGSPTSGQGFSRNGYNPKPGERTLRGYVEQNASPEISLYTGSAGFNNNNGNIGGQFKRIGAEPGHGINGPHVHQPLRNVAPDGSVFGDVGSKTKNGGVTSPTIKDVKQLYEYIENGKYH